MTTVGLVGKFRPLHLGHQKMLEELCETYGHVIIGIGSSNRYNQNVPFTASETEDMLRLALAGHDNYTIIRVPDYGHILQFKDGDRWQKELISQMDSLGGIDFFVTGNPYVSSLLGSHYKIIAPQVRFEVSSSFVRYKIAADQEWQDLVSPKIHDYIAKRGLDKRLRQEFGHEILNKGIPKHGKTSVESEMRRVMQYG
ncbi:MAG: adenylyltransferase/cytidyltransferase family protein [Candidatus Woesearchaeota archaeon]|nr:adenylyltransferase/cytidyltransferase family protein [Candidatus Woesearchaeota archaeon]